MIHTISIPSKRRRDELQRLCNTTLLLFSCFFKLGNNLSFCKVTLKVPRYWIIWQKWNICKRCYLLCFWWSCISSYFKILSRAHYIEIFYIYLNSCWKKSQLACVKALIPEKSLQQLYNYPMSRGLRLLILAQFCWWRSDCVGAKALFRIIKGKSFAGKHSLLL